MSESIYTSEKLFVKNMVCQCCIRLLKQEFEKAGIFVTDIKLGTVSIAYNSAEISFDKITNIISELGFSLVVGRDEMLVEQIKLAVIELVHYLNNVNSIIRKSDYLVEKLGYTYQHLSKVFSKHETITLERFIILHKIERIMELIDGNEFTLSEIAYMMDYSSVQHLSMQFRNITGLTVSEYKKSDKSIRKPLDALY